MTAEFMSNCEFCKIEWAVEQLEESIREVEAEGGSAGELQQRLSDALYELYEAEPCEHKRARDEVAIFARQAASK